MRPTRRAGLARMHCPEPDPKLLSWEVLVAATRPSTSLGAAAVMACGFVGGHPVVRHTAAISATGMPAVARLPDLLAALSMLKIIPPEAPLHMVFTDPQAVKAMLDADLPKELYPLMHRLMLGRSIHLEAISSHTPAILRLLAAAQAALPQARTYEEVVERLAA